MHRLAGEPRHQRRPAPRSRCRRRGRGRRARPSAGGGRPYRSAPPPGGRAASRRLRRAGRRRAAPARFCRSTTAPASRTRRSPGSTRRMSAKIGLAPGGEFQLHQLGARLRPQYPPGQPGRDQRLRLRGEGENVRRFNVVELLDAERIAGEHHPPARRVIDGDGVHAAQRGGESRPLARDRAARRIRSPSRCGRPLRPARREAQGRYRSRRWRPGPRRRRRTAAGRRRPGR